MDWQTLLLANWHVKLVCLVLILAAWIDGKQLRVPNWLTFPMVASGLAFCTWTAGWTGLQSSLWGMAIGLLCLLPLYSVGGMGAGDVKLMAGIGAWLGAQTTLYAFGVSAVVGGLMAVWMVFRRKSFARHYTNVWIILNEFLHVRDPRQISRIAAERKPQMLLLPYGIPICIGSIAYFFYAGMI